MEGNVWNLSDIPSKKHKTKLKKNAVLASLQSAPIILETPPPDVVGRVSQYFEHAFRNSEQEKQSDCYHSSNHHIVSSPESNSGDSLFITQIPVPEAVWSARRSPCESRLKHYTFTDGDEDEAGDGLSGAPRESVSSGIISDNIGKGRLKQYSFPFLANIYQSKNFSGRERHSRGAHLPIRLNASLASSVVGGFFKCVKAKSGLEIARDKPSSSPRYLDEEESLSPLSELEGSSDESEDIKLVDRRLHAYFVTQCIQTIDTQSNQKKKDKAMGKPSRKKKSVSPKRQVPERSQASRRKEVPIDPETVSSEEQNSSCRHSVVKDRSTINIHERGKSEEPPSDGAIAKDKPYGPHKLKKSKKNKKENSPYEVIDEGVQQPSSQEWPEGRELANCAIVEIGEGGDTPGLSESTRGEPAEKKKKKKKKRERSSLSLCDAAVPERSQASRRKEVPIETVSSAEQNSSCRHAVVRDRSTKYFRERGKSKELPSDGAIAKDKPYGPHKLKRSKKDKKENSPYEVIDGGVQQPSSQEWPEGRELANCAIAEIGEGGDTPGLSESTRGEPAERQKKKKKKRERSSLSLCDAAVPERSQASRRKEVPIDPEMVSSAEQNSSCRHSVVRDRSTKNVCERGKSKELPSDGAIAKDKPYGPHKLKKSKKNKKENSPYEVIDEGVQQPSSQEWPEGHELANCAIAEIGGAGDTPGLSESTRGEPAERQNKKKKERSSLSLCDAAVQERSQASRRKEVPIDPETVSSAEQNSSCRHSVVRDRSTKNVCERGKSKELPSDGAIAKDKPYGPHKLKKSKKNKKENSLYEVIDEGVQQPSSQEWPEGRELANCAIAEIGEGRDTPGLSESTRGEPAERQKKKKKKRERNSLSLCDATVPEEEESVVTSLPECDMTQASDETLKKKKRKKENAVVSEEGQAGTVNRLHPEVDEAMGLRVGTTETSQNELELTLVKDIQKQLLCGNVINLSKRPDKNTPVSASNDDMELRQEESEVFSILEAATLLNEYTVIKERKKKRKKIRAPCFGESEDGTNHSTAPHAIEMSPKSNTTEISQDATKCAVADDGEVVSHASSSLLSDQTEIRDSEMSEKTLPKAMKHLKRKKRETLDSKIQEDSLADDVGIGSNNLSHAEIEPFAKKSKKNRKGKYIWASEEEQTVEIPEETCDIQISSEIGSALPSRGIVSFLDIVPSEDNVAIESNSLSPFNAAGTTKMKSSAKKKKRKNSKVGQYSNEEPLAMELSEVTCDSPIPSDVQPPPSGGKVSFPDRGKKKNPKKDKRRLYNPEKDYLIEDWDDNAMSLS